jgi:putative ABC transport system permease protein
MLGVFGGIGGLALGSVSARVLTETFGWPMLISPDAVVVSVAFSAGIGLVFGYYPARQASALDPIDALRSE